MTTASDKGDKTATLSTTIYQSQMDFLDTHKANKKYKDRSIAVQEAISLLQATEAGLGSVKAASPFGVSRIIYPANGQDYSDLMANAKTLTLVFNDMRRWLGNHSHREVLRSRLVENRSTRILLLHPKSGLIGFVAKISNKLKIVGGKNRQVRDIESAVRRLCTGLWSHFAKRQGDETEHFEVIGHRFLNTYTMVMTERECWVVWYPIAKRYNEGVIFVFEKTETPEGLYMQFKNDIDELEREAKDDYRDSDLVKLYGPGFLSTKTTGKKIEIKDRVQAQERKSLKRVGVVKSKKLHHHL